MKTTTQCPRCAYVAGVTGNRGTIKIRCPKCSNEWRYTPPVIPDRVIEIPFRCATNGNRFFVELARAPGAAKFRITRIYEPEVNHFVMPKVLSNVGGRALSKVSKALSPFVSRGPAHRHRSEQFADCDNAPIYNADELDWSGFRCGVCGNGHAIRFVYCGGCRSYICLARAIAIDGGGWTFQCYDACGGSGEITLDRHIPSYQVSSEVLALQEAAPTRLDVPRNMPRQLERSRRGRDQARRLEPPR